MLAEVLPGGSRAMGVSVWLRPPLLVLALLASAGSEGAGSVVPDCLYAFSQGDEQVAVEPCSGDVLGIGANSRVISVMRYFDIAANVVAFRSCPGGRFSARPHEADSGRFVITYPSSANLDYLAAVVHELSHVVQIRSAGGLNALDPKANSRRIELGADFLTGLAFNGVLKHLKFGNFETSLNLIGSYKAARSEDHGLPGHRAQAFRLGAVRAEPYKELTTAQALDYFYGNDYARLAP
ncbi:MAG: hypothetical protein LBJ40_14415 [Delftia acidovorans]|nr:hypothetical protein [Delftia acidovorans]